MKKTILKMMLFALLTALLTVCAMGTSAAVPYSTMSCIDETVEVTSFEQLKTALENYSWGQNIVLYDNINIDDNSKDYSINITGSDQLALDFNGYQLTVNSTSTKYLFNITGNARLYLLNGNRNKESVVTFNTTKPSAALLKADHKFCEVYNINVKYVMGDKYTEATDKSDTAVFSINKAYEVGIYGGVLTNKMSGGNGVVVSANSDNDTYLTFNIGGNTKIQSKKYCVNFDPSNIKNVTFGASEFEGNGSYERIKVPSASTLTVGGLWPSPESGASTTVYCGNLVQSKSKKITALSKADINVDKTCEVLNNADPFVVLECAAGHIELCGVCKMSYFYNEPHDNQFVGGTAATCTTPGKTTGYYCKTCYYSNQSTTPPLGHSMTYNKGKAASCGVDGINAHYYCGTCRSYFKDKDGKTKLNYDKDVVIKNNHEIRILNAVAPTCTQDGLTQGKKCLTCNRTVTKQETVPKTGHKYPSDWTLVKRATCEEEGMQERICMSCGNRETQKISKLLHSYNKNGKCIDCGKDKNDPEPNPNPGTDNPGSSGDNTVNCSCSCHKNGIIKFLFKIILFFQKIFRINQYCKGCGIAHY